MTKPKTDGQKIKQAMKREANARTRRVKVTPQKLAKILKKANGQSN